jgi:hypothetical protein
VGLTAAVLEVAMYIRVTRAQLDPAKLDEFVPIDREIASIIKTLPGFLSFMRGTDRSSGKIIAINTWGTAEQAAVSRDASGDVLGRLLAIGTQMDPPEIYEASN